MSSKVMRNLIFSLVLLMISFSSISQELVEVSPITDKILMLKWKEGTIEYAAEGEWWGNGDVVNRSIMDTSLIKKSSSFLIRSETDARYNSANEPDSVGFKMKVHEATWKDNTPILNHTVYLFLPDSLIPGNTYTINYKKLGTSDSVVNYFFDPLEVFSETIHISQIGFVPDAAFKVGYLYQWLGDAGPLDLSEYEGQNFHLIDENNNVKYTGKITKRKDIDTGSLDSYNKLDGSFYSGADVYECNFSEYTNQGDYLLYVPGIGVSFPFSINQDVYHEAFVTAARGMYHHRSGPAREEPYSSFPKDVDHMPGVDNFKVLYSDLRWIDRSGNNGWFKELVENKTSREMPEAWGGWFDAGDFDRQAKHMVVSQLMLLNYIIAPTKYTDGELNIPESGNGIPDIIDEAIWGIDVFRRCKGPSGGIIGGIEAEDHPHQTGSVLDGSKLDWYTYAEGPGSSFIYTQSTIQEATALEIAGKPNSQFLYSEAADAYHWAMDNMRTGDRSKIGNEWLSAAAWMYNYTGDTTYQNHFEDLYNSNYKGDNYYTGLAGYLLANHPNKKSALHSSVHNYIISQADDLVEAAEQRASRLGSLTLEDYTAVGKASTPYNQSLNLAYTLTGEQKYLDYSQTTADYFLGGNAINLVYVTGLGERAVSNTFNLDAFYDGIEEDIPGIVPYGFHTWGNWMDGGDNVFSPNFNYTHMYPERTEWPSHEFYWENRYCIITNEYTIWQTIGPAVSSYAYLVDDKVEVNYDSVSRLVITQPLGGDIFMKDDEIHLKFLANQGKGKFDQVSVFVNGNEFATISDSNFEVSLKDLPVGDNCFYIRSMDQQGNQLMNTMNEPVCVKTINNFNPNISLTSDNNYFEEDDTINILLEEAPAQVNVTDIEIFVNDKKLISLDSIQAYAHSFPASLISEGTHEVFALYSSNLPNKVSTDTLSFVIGSSLLQIDTLKEFVFATPNPSSGKLILHTEEELLLFDLKGQYYGSFKGMNKEIDINYLEPGVYILMKANNLKQVQRLIKK